MAYLNLKIEGLTEVLEQYKKAPEFIFKVLNTAVETSSQLIWRNIRLVTPVKTGNLRAGIYPDPISKPLYRTIASHNAPYAVYVEGRRKFFVEGVSNSEGNINTIVQNSVNKISDYLSTK